MSNCYLCNKAFDGSDVENHGEHIIQNMIGGHLIADYILCRKCGARLGSSIDNGLGEALRALCVVFDIRRHRDKRLVVSAETTLKDGLILEPSTRQFFVEAGVAPQPDGPAVIRDDSTMVAHIFVKDKKQKRIFEKSPLFRKLESKEYDLRFGSDAAQLIDHVILRVDYESVDLARGLIKIAVGYARHNGIDRQFLKHLIVDNEDLISNNDQIHQTVLPYYPTGWGECLYEAERYETDDFPPNHQLLLFSHGQRLFCYVDLFGVIQRYVLLSKTWSGPNVRARYVQRCPKWVYDETDGRPRRLKDLHIMAQEFGIKTTERPWDDIERDVRQAATTRPYSLCPRDHLAKPGAMLEQLILASSAPAPVPEVIRTVRRRAAIAEANFGCDINRTIEADRIRPLLFLRTWDREDFRITNENGFSPDLSARVDPLRLAKYRELRLRQFSEAYAKPWSLEAR